MLRTSLSCPALIGVLSIALFACGGTGTTPGGDLGTSTGGAAGAVGGGGKAGAAGKSTTTGKGGTTGASGQGQGGGVLGGGGTGQGATAAGGNPGAGGVGSTAGTSSGAGTGGSDAFGGGGAPSTGGSGGSGLPVGCTSTTPDQDKDGYTVAQGDCNDCDPNVNPGAIDVLQVDAAGNPLPASMQTDNDCDGKVANPAEFVCDDGLAVDDADPFNGAKAIELCQKQSGTKWGVISASYIQIDGNPLPAPNGPLGHGVLSAFGPNVAPKKGKRMLGLSSGTARQPSDPGYQDVSGFDKGYTSGFLPGFPIESPACPGTVTGEPHDSVALKLQIKVPTNAKSFSFKFKFYTYEFPDFICSTYNDFFTVLMDPAPMDVNQKNKNIVFDAMKNPISVNNAFLDVCKPQSAGGKNFTCVSGPSQLVGTGFDDVHAGTSWLVTQANVTPGTNIWLEFAAFDSGDGILDSTGIADDFEWSATPGTGTMTHKP